MAEVSYIAQSRSVTAPGQLFHKRAWRTRMVLVGLTIALFVVFWFSVGIGAVSISPLQVLSILVGALGIDTPWPYSQQQEMVLLAIRLPRVFLAILVGAGLSVSGASMQGLFRNPLADPGLIGVSSGAAVAAVTVIVFGAHLVPRFDELGHFLIQFAAFGGSIGATFFVYRISTRYGKTSVATMLLAGIAINALAGAGTGFMTLYADDTQLRDITFWTLGSIGGATWSTFSVVAPFILIGLVLTPFIARPLNAMLLGEREAQHLGINTEKLKIKIVYLTGLMVGVAVAITGIIGFVGLVVPHLLRITFGPDHRLLLPGSALLGATLLLGADLIARTILAPAELPIGLVTASVGAPFFLWLLLHNQRHDQLGF